MKYQSGSAAIIVVFVLGLVSLLIGTSLVQTGYVSSTMGRDTASSSQAFYAAQSGVEEAFYKIQNIPDYGLTSSETFTLDVGDSRVSVTVSGTESRRKITSIGEYDRFVRRIETEVQDTSLRPGFEYAIHSGVGGIELRHTTQISGKDTANGNIFSNGSIYGAKSDHYPTGICKNSASGVDGNAWAVEKIDKLETNDSGICVTKDAYADEFNYCYIDGTPYGPNSPSPNCTSGQPWVDEPKPTPVPLADMDIADFKDHLNRNGDVWTGNCVADGLGGPEDCTEGTGIIGNLIIDGSLTKPSNDDLTISGPVWVKRDVLFESNGVVSLTPDITEVSQMIVADDPIVIDSNVTFGSNGTAFLFFISTYVPGSGGLCEDPTISLSSNTESVLFYATEGCVYVTANSTFHGAILGEKIHVDNNSSIEYDPALATTQFGITKEGGWQTFTFKEI